jgi:hypothetical protein
MHAIPTKLITPSTDLKVLVCNLDSQAIIVGMCRVSTEKIPKEDEENENYET